MTYKGRTYIHNGNAFNRTPPRRRSRHSNIFVRQPEQEFSTNVIGNLGEMVNNLVDVVSFVEDGPLAEGVIFKVIPEGNDTFTQAQLALEFPELSKFFPTEINHPEDNLQYKIAFVRLDPSRFIDDADLPLPNYIKQNYSLDPGAYVPLNEPRMEEQIIFAHTKVAVPMLDDYESPVEGNNLKFEFLDQHTTRRRGLAIKSRTGAVSSSPDAQNTLSNQPSSANFNNTTVPVSKIGSSNTGADTDSALYPAGNRPSDFLLGNLISPPISDEQQRSEILKACRSWIGLTESDIEVIRMQNRYKSAWGYSPDMTPLPNWCLMWATSMIFASVVTNSDSLLLPFNWDASRQGGRTPDHPLGYWEGRTRTLLKNAMSAGVLKNKAKPGDLILYTQGHAAIVEKVIDGTVYTIEGNISDKVVKKKHTEGRSFVSGRQAYYVDPVEGLRKIKQTLGN